MAAHTLILLRHAKSDWSGGEADIDRPLAPRGRRQAPEAGAWLAHHIVHIDRAVVSAARRARSTWDLAAAELASRPELLIDNRLYAASDRELLAVVRELPEGAETVVMVGHNPGFEDLAWALTGEEVAMPTSALAVITVPGPWSATGPDSGMLRASGRPPGALLGS
jgi:phosphohistidine phosphatase